MSVYSDLFSYRELFANLFRRDLQKRYKGSALGVVWVAAAAADPDGDLPARVPRALAASTVERYPLYLLSGLATWVFFATTVQIGSRAMLDNAELIRKTRFPRQLVAFSVVGAQVVTYAVTLAILLVAVLPLRAGVARDGAARGAARRGLFVPSSPGSTLIIACLDVVFRDVEHLIGALLLPWFFVTPVFWDWSLFTRHQTIVRDRPLREPGVAAVSAIRDPLWAGTAPRAVDVIYLVCEVVVALALGAFTFRRSTTGSRSSCDDRAVARSRREVRARRADAGVVHAPGGTLAAGVPRAARAARLLRARRHARAVRRGDAAAGAPPRRRRRGDLRGHHDAGRRDGRRREARRGRRAGRRLVLGPISCASPTRIAPAVCEAIRIVRGELDDERAVVGFCGAPFTVAGYLVEGKPSRDFARTKALMYREPRTWHTLMETLAEGFSRYVREQVDAGADVIQLFDSWVGALSPADYREFVAPYSSRILDAVDVPTIHFGTGTATLLDQLDGDVVGLDWRVPLDDGWDVVGDRGVQGNLDPAALLAPWDRVEAAALDVLERRARPQRAHLQPRPRDPAADGSRRRDAADRARADAHRRGARMSEAVVLMAYGSPSGSRTCPRTTPTSAAAGRSRRRTSRISSSATAGSASRSTTR